MKKFLYVLVIIWGCQNKSEVTNSLCDSFLEDARIWNFKPGIQVFFPSNWIVDSSRISNDYEVETRQLYSIDSIMRGFYYAELLYPGLKERLDTVSLGDYVDGDANDTILYQNNERVRGWKKYTGIVYNRYGTRISGTVMLLSDSVRVTLTLDFISSMTEESIQRIHCIFNSLKIAVQ